jgi:hypothetical protein
MARKPRSQWSPAYRRRMESAEARGLTRQQARGHRPHEHVTRKAGAGLPGGQAAQIDKFARQQAQRRGADPDEASARLKQWVRDKGYDAFRRLKGARDRRMREKRQRQTEHVTREGGGRVTLHISTGPGLAGLADDLEDFDLPDMDDDHDDIGWLFYH